MRIWGLQSPPGLFHGGWGLSYIPAKVGRRVPKCDVICKEMVSFSIQKCFFFGCRRSIIACFAKFARSLLLQVACFTDPAATDIKYGEKPGKGPVPLRILGCLLFFIGKSSGFDSKDVGLELLKMRLSFAAPNFMDPGVSSRLVL